MSNCMIDRPFLPGCITLWTRDKAQSQAQPLEATCDGLPISSQGSFAFVNLRKATSVRYDKDGWARQHACVTFFWTDTWTTSWDKSNLWVLTQALVTPPLTEESELLRQELSQSKAELLDLKGKLESTEKHLLEVCLFTPTSYRVYRFIVVCDLQWRVSVEVEDLGLAWLLGASCA